MISADDFAFDLAGNKDIAPLKLIEYSFGYIITGTPDIPCSIYLRVTIAPKAVI